jgi:hypothetical protein
MRTIVLAAIVGVLVGTSPAGAQQYHYDWQSGNSYYTTPGIGGGAIVQGFNLQNGSNWHTNIDPHGNMNGFDARGNYWQYNRGSSTYMNFGTGRMCVGAFCN